MTTKSLARSFAGGELTPEMFGRVDLNKYQVGLALAQNFEILPHGPARNRAGWEFIIEAKFRNKKSTFLPFIFSTTQSYVLEFGDQYIRFHTLAGTVLETPKAITGVTQANPGVVTSNAHGFSNGQWLFLSGIGGMTALNGRWVIVAGATANTFQLTDLGGIPIDTTALPAYTAGGTAARVYEIASPYLEADLFSLHYTQSADVFTLVHPSYQQAELKRLGATLWTLTNLSFSPVIGTPAAPAVSAHAAGAFDFTYLTTAVSSDGLEESLGSPSTHITGADLGIAGNFNLITSAAVAGALRYNIYKLSSGLFGFIGQSDGSAFTDDNITADISRTPPIANDPFVGAGNFPGAVGYFQGRRWFAGTNNKPQNVFGTRSGTEKNMSYSVPSRDDDSISVRLVARQANQILHLVPIGQLLLLTSGSEWKIGSANSDVITPSTISYTPEDYIGANQVQPVVTSSAILYPQDRGCRVRELQYSWQQQGYNTNDISVLAPHLFDGFTITSIAFARAPYPFLWAVRSDGVMLGLSYLPTQDVRAWHHHTTDGSFESVCVIPEGSDDIPYAVVKRTVNGQTVRYVERLRERQFTTLAASFFVDAGVTYNGAATLKVSGLWHLIGKTVAILADGAVQPQQVVAADSSITLQHAASVIQIGLPYNADFQTVPLSFDGPAFGQGVPKNVNKVHLRVDKSSGVFAGPSFDKLKEYKQRTNEPYGVPPNVVSGVLTLDLTPTWQQDGSVCVRQANPLPLTVLSMTLEFAQ